MSFFIDKHGRRKSPIALAACGAALLDLAVYFCTAALLAGPLYRTVSFGGETVTSMLHTIIITVISTLFCCLLFLLKDKRVVPYGFAGLAVILLMFCAAAWMLPQETRGSMLRLFLTVGCLATPSAGPSTEGCERRIPSISSERPSRRS